MKNILAVILSIAALSVTAKAQSANTNAPAAAPATNAAPAQLYTTGKVYEGAGVKQMCVLVHYESKAVEVKAGTKTGRFLDNVVVRTGIGALAQGGGSIATKKMSTAGGAAVNAGIGGVKANTDHAATQAQIDQSIAKQNGGAGTEIIVTPSIVLPPNPMQVEIGKEYTVAGKSCKAELRTMKGKKVVLDGV